MSNDDLIAIGFNPLPHYTVGNNVRYDLGRNRELSASCVGTPNEMLFISEVETVNGQKQATSVIILHNYDYDGPLKIEKVKAIIHAITGTHE